ncbi:hypothetical protein GPECTOR_12g601 [Gonium pectorale]|uniref:CAAX prenyl protease 2/Lysostaphin resistance protein A-like domain-containing protein n=1 Tax=Gonium pectorale TaxID=33097 RepID=A0A150GP83_GONPE|nr:hypothetical protein GPECTOR_12g601 [Gonium pectorale]|eukprot:KXZ51637.1 hypothetical protein GPECTOR_12g601 [Gonium pectorale]
MDGLNWWCYTVLGLIFITDFTPLGPLLLSGSGPSAGLVLAGVQWGFFVLPTINHCREQGWPLGQVLRLRPCEPASLATGALAGAALWLLTAVAIAARTGTDLAQLSAAAAAAAAAGAGASGAAGPGGSMAGLLFGQLLSRPDDPAQWALALATSALSPAVAEELLYRGFLLTALQQRFGRLDAVALSAAAFAVGHLSIEQFFPLCLLGGLAGGLAARSGSILPAVAAHAGFNAAGLAAGVALVTMAGRG